MIKIMCVFGTRPEAIKMCPLIKQMENHEEIESVVCLTGQHKEMLKQVVEVFDIDAKYNLSIMLEKQTLSTITTSILNQIESVLEEEKPELLLVHGDTTTSFAAALAAFYQKIPVGHVEAGLRTYCRYFPYPEEVNRNLTGRIAELHFAPTEKSRENLLRENISQYVYVTGNTVIDAFQTTVQEGYRYNNSDLQQIMDNGKQTVLITAHRRENLGKPLQSICNAIKQLALQHPDVNFVYPVHLNPLVRDTVYNMLDGISNVKLLPPLNVLDLHNLLSQCFLVLTDSGGLQEEAPYWGVPVLVLRSETERPEAVEAGVVKVVGTDTDRIVAEAEKLFCDSDAYACMAQAVSPYGNGHASELIIKHIMEWYNGKYNKGII